MQRHAQERLVNSRLGDTINARPPLSALCDPSDLFQASYVHVFLWNSVSSQQALSSMSWLETSIKLSRQGWYFRSRLVKLDWPPYCYVLVFLCKWARSEPVVGGCLVLRVSLATLGIFHTSRLATNEVKYPLSHGCLLEWRSKVASLRRGGTCMQLV